MKLALPILLLVSLSAGCSRNDNGSTTAMPSTRGVRPTPVGEAPEQLREARSVRPDDLPAILLQADRVVVKDAPFEHAKRLFESTDRIDIEALSRALSVETPQRNFHCMCAGAPAVYLYKGRELLVQVTNHHAQSIRCSLWDSDAMIADPERWLAWFDERQIEGPRREIEQMQARRRQHDDDLRKWMAAMPEGLDDAWGDYTPTIGESDTSRLRAALNASIPEKHAQILALLSWYGSGAGPWSGFPGYEVAAETLLLEYEIVELVSAIDLAQMSPTQLEGAARLFGGWSFSQKHPDGLREVPEALKSALWDHVSGTQDKDKLSRAKHAFQ